MKNGAKITLAVLIILVLGGLFLWFRPFQNNGAPGDSNVSSSTEDGSAGTSYRNDEYGFYFALPAGWNGYNEVKTTWSGYRPYDTEQRYLLSGPFITLKDLRVPTSSQDSWQDIPIMIYTLIQWDDGKGAISQAAPVAPNELGRNNKYVFIMPARSIGFRDTLGIFEVSEWVQSRPLKTFNLP